MPSSTPIRSASTAKSVLLEKGAKDQYFVPLVGRDPETSFLLELRYSRKQTAFDLPIFPRSRQFKRCICASTLPRSWQSAARQDLGRLRSNGCGEHELAMDGGFGLVPRPVQDDRQLVQWVTEGISLSAVLLSNSNAEISSMFSRLAVLDNQPGNSLRLGTIESYGVELAGDPDRRGRSIALVRQRAAVRGLSLGRIDHRVGSLGCVSAHAGLRAVQWRDVLVRRDCPGRLVRVVLRSHSTAAREDSAASHATANTVG